MAEKRKSIIVHAVIPPDLMKALERRVRAANKGRAGRPITKSDVVREALASHLKEVSA